jgi:hypothetical protein
MPTKIRQPKAEGTQVLSDAPGSGSDARIANHLAWVLNDPAISQLENDDLGQLVDALISLPSLVAARRWKKPLDARRSGAVLPVRRMLD